MTGNIARAAYSNNSKTTLDRLPRAPRGRAKSLLALAAASGLASIAGIAGAATIQKANNTTLLNDGGSWVGGTAGTSTGVPTNADIALWDNTVVGANNSAIGGNLDWLGIKINNPGGLVTIGATAGSVLTLGNSGIDMSAATQFLTIGAAMSLNGSQNWTVATGRTLTASGIIGETTVGSGITLNGTGIVLFTGANAGTSVTNANNTFTGPLTVNSGTAQLNGIVVNQFNILSSSVPLVMGGGIFRFTQGGGTGTTTQNFASLTVNQGASLLNQGRGSSSKVVESFLAATVNRSLGGTIVISQDSNNSVIGFPTSANTNGIIGGYATLNGTDFVLAKGITTVTTGPVYTADAWGTTTNTNVTLAANTITAGTTNSLRFAAAAADTVTLAGANIISSGGILVSSGAGNVTNTINGAGTLTSGNGLDLIVHNWNAGANGALAIDASLTDNGATPIGFTKSGVGAVRLGGSNTFTGQVTINNGAVALTSATALGAGTNAIVFANSQGSSGSLALGGNNTTVGSIATANTIAAPIIQNASATGATLTVNYNGVSPVTYAGTIQDGTGAGTLGLTKSGTGTLTLGGSNTYTGNTTISTGTLALKTNISGSNTINIASGAFLDSSLVAGGLNIGSGRTLTGTGAVNGGVTLSGGSNLTPGSAGVGTLSVGSLTAQSGSAFSFELNGSPIADLVDVTASNGLTFNGGGFNIYTAGGNSQFSTAGTYDLFKYTGAVSGLANLTQASILNPVGGLTYNFATNVVGADTYVALTIGGTPALSAQWAFDTFGNWGDGSKWTTNPFFPNAPGDTANFTTALSTGRTVTLDGSKTVGIVNFDSTPYGYTIAPGTGTLTLDNGLGNAQINDLHGSHFITVPLVLNSGLSVSVAVAGDTMTLSGNISSAAAQGITKTGLGTLVLSGANTYAGNTAVNGGVLNFNGLGSLGTGNISLDNGTLQWAAGNTDDVSTRTVTINSGGATFDTGANNVILANSIGNGGTGAITKIGSGVLTLGGVNTFSGITTIKAGTLAINSDSALGTAPGAPGASIIFNPGVGNTATLQATAPLTLAANRQVSLFSGTSVIDTNGNAVTLSGALTGTGIFKKAGAGTLTLGSAVAAGTTGTTIVDDGTLNLGGNGVLALPTGAITMNNSAAITYGSANTTFAQQLNINGTNSITNTNSNTMVINKVVGPSTASLTLADPFVIDFSGDLTGFAGTIILGSNIGYRMNGSTGSGATTFDFGTGTASLSVRSSGSAIALGALTGGASTTLTGSAGGSTQAVTYTIGAKGIDTTFDGRITNGAGAVSITKTGNDTLTLTNSTNSYTGTTLVNQGTLNATAAGTLGTSATVTVNPTGVAGTTADAATLNSTDAIPAAANVTVNSPTATAIGTINAFGATPTYGSLSGTGRVVLNAAGGSTLTIGNATNTTFSGVISEAAGAGAGNLVKQGAGSLALNGVNTYTGGSTINAGVLKINSADSLGATSGAATINAGTLQATADITTARNLNLGAATSTILVDATKTYTINGVVADGAAPGTLNVTGPGTLVLGGVNTYTGNTSVAAGSTLAVAATGALPTGTNLAANGAVQFSNAAQTIGTLNGAVTGAVTANAGSVLTVSGLGAYAGAVNANGTVQFSGNTGVGTFARSVGQVNIGSGGLVKLNTSAFPATPSVLTAAGLSFADATSKLDLTNNEAIISNTTLAVVVPQIVATNIMSSTAGPGTGIGSLQLGTDVEVRYTLLGDTNLDGTVDVGDLGNLATNYGTTTGATWVQGDTNYNGEVGVGDLGDLATNYGNSLAAGPSAGGDGGELVASNLSSVASTGGSAAVPEPTALGLLGLGAMGLMSRRRRAAR